MVNAPPLDSEKTEAMRQIEAFQKRFGEKHLIFVRHAALPLAVTPKLLYQLWAKFQRDRHASFLDVPWIAVSDFLLSGLCEEVGDGLYELDKSIRDELLEQLRNDKQFGPQRIKALAHFLNQAIEVSLQSEESDERDYAQSQRWTALAYIQPNLAAKELTTALFNAYQTNQPDLLRIAEVVDALSKPLEQFPELLAYAKGLSELVKGNVGQARTAFEQLNSHSNVDGVKIHIPKTIKSDKREKKKVYLSAIFHTPQFLIGACTIVVGIMGVAITHQLLPKFMLQEESTPHTVAVEPVDSPAKRKAWPNREESKAKDEQTAVVEPDILINKNRSTKPYPPILEPNKNEDIKSTQVEPSERTTDPDLSTQVLNPIYPLPDTESKREDLVNETRVSIEQEQSNSGPPSSEIFTDGDPTSTNSLENHHVNSPVEINNANSNSSGDESSLDTAIAPIGQDSSISENTESLEGTVSYIGNGILEAGETLYRGDSGEKVLDLQKRLQELGYLGSDDLSGVYDSLTESAVMSYQQAVDLPADGLFGYATNLALFDGSLPSGLISSESASEETLDTAQTTDQPLERESFPETPTAKPLIVHLDSSALGNRVLGFGDQGADVRELQELLNSRFSPTPIDGVFGSDTQNTINSLQGYYGLPGSGILDAATLAVLTSLEPVETPTDFSESDRALQNNEQPIANENDDSVVMGSVPITFLRVTGEVEYRSAGTKSFREAVPGLYIRVDLIRLSARSSVVVLCSDGNIQTLGTSIMNGSVISASDICPAAAAAPSR
ncbi:MAG: peptidoglycan-binding protein [Cyanobacteria bacterium P01_F01_bin.150]